jgi:iron complex outermembrane receptor protein
MNSKFLKSILAGGVSALAFVTAANADQFNIPGGDLKTALDAYTAQTSVQLLYPASAVRGASTHGAKGELTATAALSRILDGTGFAMQRDQSGAVAIVRASSIEAKPAPTERLAQAEPARAAASVETVVVTSSKIKGDIQTVPIAITALSQEQLTSRQIAGGPDLIKEVPNLTFTKTNFTGYSIQIRGIGTQAISVTTDPAVAVAFNDIPFIRNHFFEQEFYDVGQVEVLRGPQGTLYGRNATAGVVNVVSAKPTDHYEAQASVDVGNYNNRRLEGMVNIPIIDDRLDIRAAAEWTKRDGYEFNETTNKPIDGRDLWSGRVTIGFRPIERLQVYAVWEHFQENDDRQRSTKQLCKKDPGPDSVDGYNIDNLPNLGIPIPTKSQTQAFHALLSQGCLPTSFYSADAFETPNGQANPIVAADEFAFSVSNAAASGGLLEQEDPYASVTQPRNLRVIQSEISPTYHAKNDTLELNADFSVTPSLTFTSQTGYNKDQLGSTEDFNRFNTTPGLFSDLGTTPAEFLADPSSYGNNYAPVTTDGVYCDPQLGCSTKMVGEDLSQERAWQLNQEFRLASNFSGPLNFSVGANYSHYRTVEDYYVFLNLITATEQLFNVSLPGDFTHCYPQNSRNVYSAQEYYASGALIPRDPYLIDFGVPGFPPVALTSNFGCRSFSYAGSIPQGTYIDPNPITSLDGQGHNYFRSENPYSLNSYAGFGEVYYQVTPDVKLTGGLRWTDDKKRFWNIPSWVFLEGGGYPVQDIEDQQWKEWTGRFNATWTPKLDFTDATMIYGSFARGYKGGGANPPGPEGQLFSPASLATHPLTFAPEFVNAFEAGTKNTLLDGSLTLNGDIFYYDYKGYQISQIVDRTSINLNFDAKVKGAEVEATWEPLPGLRFNFAGGLEDSSVNRGQSAIDLMDRTAGNTDWMVVKPSVADTSNCILPATVVRQILQSPTVTSINGSGIGSLFVFLNPCDVAYKNDGSVVLGGVDLANVYGIPTSEFDPAKAPNGGAGFSKDLSGNKLPNTPPFTLSLGGQYTMPLSEAWAATLHGDFYWQGNSFARIFNDRPYDKLRGYSTTNLALILTNQDGWEVMAYMKNVFDKTAITGAFLNSDDTWLSTNVFVTDPRLFGLRITKNF